MRLSFDRNPSMLPPLLIFTGMAMLLVASFIATWHPPVLEIVPSQTGQAERCLTCHNGIEPISAAHPISEFGCVSCHGGDRLATETEAAHTGMVRNPAALDVADKYCGSCHAAQTVLAQRSIMGTYTGAIALVRRAFGAQPDSKAQMAVTAIGDLQAFRVSSTDPAPIHQFADNCLSCHLRADSRKADYFYRSTGCSSCHVLYDNNGLYAGSDPAIPRDKPGYPARHQFTTAIPYTQCNHCHNRGNYDLRTMTFLARNDMPAPAGLSDQQKRLHDYYQPIGKFTKCEWELECIDCHTSQEVMGDGVLHNNKIEAQYVQCQTCHGTTTTLPTQATIADENDAALTRARLNPHVDLKLGSTILMTSRGEPLWHIRQENNKWLLTGKATGTRYEVPLVMGSQCKQKPDEQASHYCHECHAVDRGK